MQEFEVIFYAKENGEEPAKEFLMSLDEKMRAKIVRAISRLERNGIELRMCLHKVHGAAKNPE